VTMHLREKRGGRYGRLGEERAREERAIEEGAREEGTKKERGSKEGRFTSQWNAAKLIFSLDTFRCKRMRMRPAEKSLMRVNGIKG
jgi:hypothetical protein